MEEFFIGSGWLRSFVLGTYLFQIAGLIFFHIPSSVSTTKSITRRLALKGEPAENCRPAGEHISEIKMLLLGFMAFSALIISLLPLIVFIFPEFYTHLWQLPLGHFLFVRILSAGLLVFGNSLSLVAILTLRRKVTFHRIGETEKLLTDGIFGIIRNPIVVSLGMIFFGLVLAVPSFVMLLGFMLFALNQHFRIKEEEEYLIYRERVGRYFPKILRINWRLE